MINLKNRSLIKLGRGHEADIRISDISVSRLHAIIRLENNGLFLEDKKSKFGSLVLCKKGVQLDRDHPHFQVQVGKTLFQLSACDKSALNGPISVGFPDGPQNQRPRIPQKPKREAGNDRSPERPSQRAENNNRAIMNTQPPQRPPSSPALLGEAHAHDFPRPIPSPESSSQRLPPSEMFNHPNHHGLIPAMPPSIQLAETGVFHNRNAPLSVQVVLFDSF